MRPKIDIKHVIVDRRVLTAFKNRCFKAYPKEHIEAIMGTLKGDILYIHAFEEFNILKANNSGLIYEAKEEEEVNTDKKISYYGGIHTHPDDMRGPSRTDWTNFNKEVNEYVLHDEIMGIAYISKKKGRKFFGITFYTGLRDNIDLIIAEGKKEV